MKSFALATIRFYQRHISPGMGSACRFAPTCSQYAHDAIDRYGMARGVLMSAWRILRCNPLNDGGFDPVPESGLQPEGHSRAS